MAHIKLIDVQLLEVIDEMSRCRLNANKIETKVDDIMSRADNNCSETNLNLENQTLKKDYKELNIQNI